MNCISSKNRVIIAAIQPNQINDFGEAEHTQKTPIIGNVSDHYFFFRLLITSRKINKVFKMLLGLSTID